VLRAIHAIVPRRSAFLNVAEQTMRREFLDHVLFWNGRDRERKLGEFQGYYNAARCHAPWTATRR